ncbi:hypothetical protein [Psychroserpens damuponensis]|uniref:hypothetical protein n=1 Tax=Psychroserpens damuponensis TaxID=943936 RepID=UPI00058E5926|nr:hypothetical protein [Psychroserpens damuponensis]
MRKALLIVVALLCFTCSSDDDSSNTNLNLNLLYGTWYHVDLCQEYNRLILDANQNYSTRYSGSQDCDDPEPDIYEFSGTFGVSGNFIIYTETNAELIVDGTNLSVLDFINPDIKHEILELTTTTLVINSYLEEGNNIVRDLGTATYEH